MNYPEIIAEGTNFSKQLVAEGDRVYALSKTQVVYVNPEKSTGFLYDYKTTTFDLIDNDQKLKQAIALGEEITHLYK